MKRLFEQIAGWPDSCDVPIAISGHRLITRGAFKRMLSSARYHVDASQLQPGERCVLALSAPVYELVAMLALMSAGVVPVCVPLNSPPLARRAMAQALGVDAILLGNNEDAIEGARAIKWSHQEFRDSRKRSELTGPATGHEPAIIIFTEGVEGRPRPIQLSMAALDYRAEAAARALELDERSRLMCAGVGPERFPIALGALSCGAVQVFENQNPLRSIVCQGISHAVLGPRPLQQLARQVQREPTQLPTLKRVQTWAERLSPGLIQLISQNVTENLYGGFHMPEIGIISIAGPQALRDSPHCRGMACDGVNVKIKPVTTRLSPIEVCGELLIGTAPGAGEYLDTDSSEGEMFERGWFGTDMLVRSDHQGLLFMEGRKRFQVDGLSNALLTGEVERQILEQGAAEEAVALGVTIPAGRSVMAIVVATRDEQERCERLLQRQGIGADAAIFVWDEIPKTRLGGVAMKRLQSQLQDRVLSQGAVSPRE